MISPSGFNLWTCSLNRPVQKEARWKGRKEVFTFRRATEGFKRCRSQEKDEQGEKSWQLVGLFGMHWSDLCQSVERSQRTWRTKRSISRIRVGRFGKKTEEEKKDKEKDKEVGCFVGLVEVLFGFTSTGLERSQRSRRRIKRRTKNSDASSGLSSGQNYEVLVRFLLVGSIRSLTRRRRPKKSDAWVGNERIRSKEFRFNGRWGKSRSILRDLLQGWGRLLDTNRTLHSWKGSGGYRKQARGIWGKLLLQVSQWRREWISCLQCFSIETFFPYSRRIMRISCSLKCVKKIDHDGNSCITQRRSDHRGHLHRIQTRITSWKAIWTRVTGPYRGVTQLSEVVR